MGHECLGGLQMFTPLVRQEIVHVVQNLHHERLKQQFGQFDHHIDAGNEVVEASDGQMAWHG